MDDKFLLVLFYSASGSVKNLAHAISDGAEEHGLKVKIRTVPKVSSNPKKLSLIFLIQEKFIAPKKILLIQVALQ